MSDPKSTFMPAPRPKAINDPEATRALQEATADLGFSRKTSAEDAAPAMAQAPATSATPTAAPTPATPVAPPKAAEAASIAKVAPRPKVVKVEPAPAFDERETSIKFAISDELSTALKLDAVQRRVTVKYIILEALAAKGYPIDLVNLPQDGRRAKK